jgi:hypothetical protein
LSTRCVVIRGAHIPGARRATISAARDHYAASIIDFVLQAVTHSSAGNRA